MVVGDDENEIDTRTLASDILQTSRVRMCKCVRERGTIAREEVQFSLVWVNCFRSFE